MTFFSFIRSAVLVALMATGMVMLANTAQAEILSAAEYYKVNAQPLQQEARRLKQQISKALELHQKLQHSQISTRRAFYGDLHQLSLAEKNSEEILNEARFRIGIPLKSGMDPQGYPAIDLSLNIDNPAYNRPQKVRDVARNENRRYKEVLNDNEDRLEELQEQLGFLAQLEEELALSHSGKEAKRQYEHYLRRLSNTKQRYYQALNEFCVAAAQAEFTGLSGRRLIPTDSPFQLYPEATNNGEQASR